MCCSHAPAPTAIYTLSLHDALPICLLHPERLLHEHNYTKWVLQTKWQLEVLRPPDVGRSEEHTSELQSLRHLVCRLLLEKKKENAKRRRSRNRTQHSN